LSSRIARGRLLVHEVVDLIGQACVGVAAAHAAGIVHRDLKPDNLFVIEIDGRPFIKILDFGISKFDASTTGGMALTKEGAAMGTPYYMSPEQIRGLSNLDARADVYALGVILYECLSGKRPFESEVLTHLAILIHAGECEPIERLRQDLPPGFAELVRLAMASDRDKRLQSATELRSRLERYGQISFRTQTNISSLPPPSMVPARSMAMATSGVGVSMQTPPPVPGSKRGLVLGGLALLAVAALGGGVLALRSNGSVAASAPSSSSPEAPTGVKAEPSPQPAASELQPPTAPPSPAIADEKAQPPPGAPSASQSAPATLHSAPTPITAGKPGRSEQRGLAKDNPFK
jgi:serine/threonine-protein kinase